MIVITKTIILLNMKKYLILLLLAIPEIVSAQSIKTTVIRSFDAQKMFTTVHSFTIGDTVTIHAFKKKSDKYNFVVETEDYASRIVCLNIPFDVTEKQLKKLPNALDSDMGELIKNLQKNVESRQKQKCKQQALAGNYKRRILANYSLYPSEGAVGKLNEKDEVYIVGYKINNAKYEYALYNDKIAGIFSSYTNNNLFSSKLDLQHLPSTDDADVQQLIAEKQRIISQRRAEEKLQYRKRALNGEIIGILSYSPLLKPLEGGDEPFKGGDTVRIIGYSSAANKHYFALYSDKAACAVSSISEPKHIFKNASSIQFDLLPFHYDQEVKTLLSKQQQIIDSVMTIKLEESKKMLAESQQKLMQLYKENDPIIVHVDSWEANSAGGIEVNLSVTNCSTQPIKYITFQGYFTNAVGDKCRNEIGGGTVWKGRGVGPIGPRPTTIENFDERFEDNKGSYNFDNLTFYSRVAAYFQLSSVTIQYMNGKTITLSGANLKKHVRY